MEHPSLVKETRIRQVSMFEDYADSTLRKIGELSSEFERLKTKYRELRETDLTVATVSDLKQKMDKVEDKLDRFIANMGLNADVLQKEAKILDKIDRLLR